MTANKTTSEQRRLACERITRGESNLETEARKLRVSRSGMKIILGRWKAREDRKGAKADAIATLEGGAEQENGHERRESDHEEALKSAGLASGESGGSTPEVAGGSLEGAGPALSPDELVEVAVGLRGEILTGVARGMGLSPQRTPPGATLEERVAFAMEISVADKGLLKVLAPVAVRSVPDLSNKIGDFAPWGFLIVLAGSMVGSVFGLWAIAKELKAQRSPIGSPQGGAPEVPIERKSWPETPAPFRR